MGQRNAPQMARTCRDHSRKPCRWERSEREACVSPLRFHRLIAARLLLIAADMRTSALIPVLVLAAAAACSKPSPAASDQAEPQPTTNAVAAAGGGASGGGGDAAAKAKEIFSNRCTPCHGPEGRGDGPASASLQPRPRDFHDKSWHASIDDAYIEKIIKYGGAAVGKSPTMPGNPDLNDAVVVAELRTLVRSFNN